MCLDMSGEAGRRKRFAPSRCPPVKVRRMVRAVDEYLDSNWNLDQIVAWAEFVTPTLFELLRSRNWELPKKEY